MIDFVTCVHLLRVSTTFYIFLAKGNTCIATWIIMDIIIVFGSPYSMVKKKAMQIIWFQSELTLKIVTCVHF